MGTDGFVAFLADLSKNDGMQNELRALAEGVGDEAAIPTDALVDFARTRGFEFTADEAVGVLELNEDELDAVAGGLRPSTAGFARGKLCYTETLPAGAGLNRAKPIPACRLFDLAGFKFF
jgi:hypothetical protein